MNQELLSLYHHCRKSKPFMLAGQDAKCSLDAARTILRFRELESQGVVRMRCEREEENYFDVYGEEELRHAERNGHPIPREQARKELIDTLERDGVWYTCSEWFDGDSWQQADSCGMHTGYRNPLDPFQNCYVVDEMAEAIRQWENHFEKMAAAV